MPTPSKVPLLQAPFVDPQTGYLTRTGNNFLTSLTGNANAATAGSVATLAGSGLAGGGSVANGISLIIASNGVTNGMIRQGLGTSVIGRMAGSTGNVADIQATADNRILGRFAGQLVFYDLASAMASVPLATYAVADLPSATPAGRVVYASNARNGAEGAGSGTGSIVVSSGSIWHIPGVATAVTA